MNPRLLKIADTVAGNSAKGHSCDIYDDIRQEILLKLSQAKPGQKRGYYWRIAKNAARDFWRRESRYREAHEPRESEEVEYAISMKTKQRRIDDVVDIHRQAALLCQCANYALSRISPAAQRVLAKGRENAGRCHFDWGLKKFYRAFRAAALRAGLSPTAEMARLGDSEFRSIVESIANGGTE